MKHGMIKVIAILTGAVFTWHLSFPFITNTWASKLYSDNLRPLACAQSPNKLHLLGLVVSNNKIDEGTLDGEDSPEAANLPSLGEETDPIMVELIKRGCVGAIQSAFRMPLYYHTYFSIRKTSVAQGYKIYVDIGSDQTDPKEIGAMTGRILDILQAHNINYKVIRDIPTYKTVMKGTQAGKMITVYPERVDDAGQITLLTAGEWRELIAELDKALIPWKRETNVFKDNAGEISYGESGRVGFRFGSIGNNSCILDAAASPDHITLADLSVDKRDGLNNVTNDPSLWDESSVPPGTLVRHVAGNGVELDSLEAVAEQIPVQTGHTMTDIIEAWLRDALFTDPGVQINISEMDVYGRHDVQRYRIQIGTERWFLKIVNNQDLSEKRETWITEAVITELARDGGMLDQVYANNPVDFMKSAKRQDEAQKLQSALREGRWHEVGQIFMACFSFNGRVMMISKFATDNSEEDPVPVDLSSPLWDSYPAERGAIFSNIHQLAQRIHRSGIAHRDIKPSNILLEAMPDGTILPKLIDFESAVVFRPNAVLSNIKDMHTPGYAFPIGIDKLYALLSPEEQKHWFDFQDEYAFEVMLLESAIGQSVVALLNQLPDANMGDDFEKIFGGRRLDTLLNNPRKTVWELFKGYLQQALPEADMRRVSALYETASALKGVSGHDLVASLEAI